MTKLDNQNSIAMEDKVNLKTKLIYGLSSFGSYTIFTVFLNSVIIFYREKLLLPTDYILWAFIVYSILNAFNGVLFGWISDKTRTSKGRRIPYLKYLAPFLAISFILVWLSPSKEQIGEIGVFIWLFLTMITFDIFYNATNIAFIALGQEMSMDNRERANIQAFVMLFGIISVLISLLIPANILEDTNRELFVYFAVFLALIQLVTMWIMAFTVREKLEFSQVDEHLRILESFRNTIKRKSFLTTVYTNFCILFIQAVIFGNIFFYIFYIFPEYDSTFIILILGAFLLCGLFSGAYFTLRINKTKGLKPAFLFSLIFFFGGLIFIGLIPGIISLFGFYFFGFGLFGAMALPNTAFGAVTDEDEVETNTRREAAIFGINTLITKPAQSLAGVFIAAILLLFQYQEPINGVQQPQSELTIFGLKLAMGIIPGLLILSSFFVFRMFPLHGKYLEEIKSKMYKMHNEKRKKLDELEVKK